MTSRLFSGSMSRRISGPRSPVSSTSNQRMSWPTLGSRGKFEPTPAISAEFALDVSRALIVDTEYSVGVGDTAQGIGEAQGIGDPLAQGNDINDGAIFSVTTGVMSVTESVGEYDGTFPANGYDGTDAVSEYYDGRALDCVGEYVLDSEHRPVDSCPWRPRRWPPGHRALGTRPTQGACV